MIELNVLLMMKLCNDLQLYHLQLLSFLVQHLQLLMNQTNHVETAEPLIIFDVKFNNPVEALGSIATIGVSCDVPKYSSSPSP